MNAFLFSVTGVRRLLSLTTLLHWVVCLSPSCQKFYVYHTPTYNHILLSIQVRVYAARMRWRDLAARSRIAFWDMYCIFRATALSSNIYKNKFKYTFIPILSRYGIE